MEIKCYSSLISRWLTLNKQHNKIQYTIDKENGHKVLQFLDIKVINNGTGIYEFDVYRKDAITNVQVKPKSCHNPRILQGIFKGFVHRAMIICSDKYIKDELAFLKNVFVENGYKENILRKIIEEATSKSTQQNTTKTSSDCIDIEQKQTISLPWIIYTTKYKENILSIVLTLSKNKRYLYLYL